MKKFIIFKTLTILVCSAFLAALGIICGKYLQIPIGNVMRFSFENTPVIMGGIIFGPVVGAVIGAVSDLIGCVLVGYEINPLVTLGATAIGFISGLINYVLNKYIKTGYGLRLTLSVIGAHLIGSVIIKTIGLSIYYAMPMHILMLWRLLNYVIVGAAETVLLYYLMKNKMLSTQINEILRKGKR